MQVDRDVWTVWGSMKTMLIHEHLPPGIEACRTLEEVRDACAKGMTDPASQGVPEGLAADDKRIPVAMDMGWKTAKYLLEKRK